MSAKCHELPEQFSVQAKGFKTPATKLKQRQKAWPCHLMGGPRQPVSPGLLMLRADPKAPHSHSTPELDPQPSSYFKTGSNQVAQSGLEHTL